MLVTVMDNVLVKMLRAIKPALADHAAANLYA
jgi:hypothetical protein